MKIKSRSTSLKALKGISKKKLSESQQRAFDELIKHGDSGLTTRQLEMRVKDRSVDARVNELIKAGWFVRTDRERRNPPTKPNKIGALASIIIVPKNVRDGHDPVPPPVSPIRVYPANGGVYSSDTPLSWKLVGEAREEGYNEAVCRIVEWLNEKAPHGQSSKNDAAAIKRREFEQLRG